MMETLVVRLLPLRKQLFWFRYSGSTLLVGLVLLLRMSLHANLHGYSFYLFLPSVFLSAFPLVVVLRTGPYSSVPCCRSGFSQSRTTAW